MFGVSAADLLASKDCAIEGFGGDHKAKEIDAGDAGMIVGLSVLGNGLGLGYYVSWKCSCSQVLQP